MTLFNFLPLARQLIRGHNTGVFYQPKSIGEALDLKAELKERGVFIAGGTDLVVLVNRGVNVAENFIDLSHIKELTAISRRNGTIELAGNVTYSQAGKLPVRCLAQASLSVEIGRAHV